MTARISTKQICEVVAKEIRAAALFTDTKSSPPRIPPWDADFEQDILSALLGGHATCAALPPLGLCHFAGTFNRHCFVAIESIEMAGEPVTLASVEGVMRASGAAGPIADELHTIRDTTPFCLPMALRERVARLEELHRRRMLIERLEIATRLLYTDGTTVDAVEESLRSLFEQLHMEQLGAEGFV